MAFLNFTIELKALVSVLTRIADSLDRAYPPSRKMELKKVGLENYTRVTDHGLYERQMQAREEEFEKGTRG